MDAKYLDYNFVKVTIEKQYVVSNIQKKGFPPENCGCHLNSLEITSVLGTNNEGDIGASGTVSLTDYKNAVFTALCTKLDNYLKNDRTSTQFLPIIDIEIECFTGKKEWSGYVRDWSFNFSGGTPSITLEWTCIPPTERDTIPLSVGSYTPGGLVKALEENYKPNIKFVDSSGKSIADDLVFTNADKDGMIKFDMANFQSCGNRQIDAYNFILRNATTKDGKNLTGEVKNGQFVVTYKDPRDNSNSTEDASTVQKLVFVQNGSFKYYQPRSKDGKIVIPMNSFSYNASMAKLVLQSRILKNMNGNIQLGFQGPDSKNSQSPEKNTESDTEGSSGVQVSFECYNVLTFSMLNTQEPVEYEIYDEFGNLSILSGKGTVNQYKISLEGAVVRASVTATECFNDSVIEVKEGEQVGGVEEPKTVQADPLKITVVRDNGSSVVDDPKDMDYETYLRMEDAYYVPLSVDKTSECLKNGKFGQHVDEFLDKYGNLESTARRLDYSFIRKLLQDGDIGLLALLYGPAHYGIKASGVPSYWGEDPVLHDPGHKKSTPWCAGNIGKLPFHYKIGGLGIAHWDAENFDDIYSACGFDSNMSESDKNHFASLLIGTPKKEKDKLKFTGKITGWKSGTYKGVPRLFPIFQGKCYMQRFDTGLKQDSKWLEWAKNIVYYNGSNGRIYQHYLFKLWLDKFWFRTMRGLKSKSPVNGHVPCLQDAVRISRAGNSRTGWIDPMCGKTVSQQYDIYKSNGSISHAMKQKAYCKRLCQILMWEYLSPNGGLHTVG